MSRAEAARARWARIMEEHRASGMTVARFCEARGIAPSSFFPWKRRLGETGTVGAAAPAAFVEAKVDATDDDGRGGVVIELARGVRIRVARGFDRELLREVIGVLEAGTPQGGDGASS